MTMEKYGIDYAAVQALLDSGECATEEEALEKVASRTPIFESAGVRTGRTSCQQENLANPPREDVDYQQLSRLGAKGGSNG